MVAAARDGIFFERFQELGVRVEELPLRRLGTHHLISVIRLIRALGIDVVHTHGKGPGLYGRLAAWWTGVPAVHTFHGIHYRGYSPLNQVLYLALEGALSRLTHTVINVSASQEAEGLRLRLFGPSQSAVVVNGVDLEALDRLLAGASIRRESLVTESWGQVLQSRIPGQGCRKARPDPRRVRARWMAGRAVPGSRGNIGP